MLKGTVHKYGENVDTDAIIPARYLTTSDPAELAKHCMEDIDADFVKRTRRATSLSPPNFGCGSSGSMPACHQGFGYFLRHRQEFRPHLLPQRHKYRPAAS